MTITTNNYLEQEAQWPDCGKYVLSQYDAETIVVYQAYRPAIAEYAVTNQSFGGEFSLNRMSWIKPNFLWMMYRSGWASKEGQERVLAIRVTRHGFDEICRQAVHSTFDRTYYEDQASWQAAVGRSAVRLQWDPDHNPAGIPVARRAVQLGLRGAVLRAYSEEWIRGIEDITQFVHEQKSVLDHQGMSQLITPFERVYPAVSEIGADHFESGVR